VDHPYLSGRVAVITKIGGCAVAKPTEAILGRAQDVDSNQVLHGIRREWLIAEQTDIVG
jgi:hypothetical protein